MAIVFEFIFIAAITAAFGLGTIANFAHNKLPPSALMGNAVAIALCGIFAIAMLVLIFAGLTVIIKRLHDRNKSAWWLLVFCALPFALNIFRFATILAHMHSGGTPIVANPAGPAAGGIAALISLWTFVEIYCLSGTKGDNHFGPDPLAVGT